MPRFESFFQRLVRNVEILGRGILYRVQCGGCHDAGSDAVNAGRPILHAGMAAMNPGRLIFDAGMDAMNVGRLFYDAGREEYQDFGDRTSGQECHVS